VCLESLLSATTACITGMNCTHTVHWSCFHIMVSTQTCAGDTNALPCPLCRVQFFPSVLDGPALLALARAGRLSKHAILTIQRSHAALAKLAERGLCISDEH
jgi:hypothetical protein